LQLWKLYCTSAPARQYATEQQEFKLNFFIIIQRATAKRDATQCPTIAKPCSLWAINNVPFSKQNHELKQFKKFKQGSRKLHFERVGTTKIYKQ